MVQIMLDDGSRDFQSIVSYNTHPTFSNDTEIVDKKYVDDNAGGVTDHGNLSGLGDDDHTQYLPTNGVRGMSGSLDMNQNDLTDVNAMDAGAESDIFINDNFDMQNNRVDDVNTVKAGSSVALSLGSNDSEHMTLRTDAILEYDSAHTFTSNSTEVPDVDYVDSGDSSSPELKENIQPLEVGLDVINNIDPITFSWRDGPPKGRLRGTIGYTASEVHSLEPRACGDEDHVDAHSMIALLISAVQSLSSKVSALDGRV